MRETVGGPTTPESFVTTRAVSLASGAAALLLACGPQPTTYLVAVDQSGLNSLAGSCYINGVPPANPTVFAPLVQHEFTFWEGAQSKKYLQVDRISVPFPSNDQFAFNGLSEGGPKQWVYNGTNNRGNNTTETRNMELNFTDLGATLVGSIAVTDTYACPSPPCGFQNCSVTLNLNGRQIETQYSGQL